MKHITETILTINNTTIILDSSGSRSYMQNPNLRQIHQSVKTNRLEKIKITFQIKFECPRLFVFFWTQFQGSPSSSLNSLLSPFPSVLSSEILPQKVQRFKIPFRNTSKVYSAASLPPLRALPFSSFHVFSILDWRELHAPPLRLLLSCVEINSPPSSRPLVQSVQFCQLRVHNCPAQLKSAQSKTWVCVSEWMCVCVRMRGGGCYTECCNSSGTKPALILSVYLSSEREKEREGGRESERERGRWGGCK